MMRLNRDCYRRMAMFLVLVAFVGFSGMAEAAPWSFAVLGDQRDTDGTWGVNAPVIQAMVKDIIENRGVSLALVGGDQIHGIYSTSTVPQASLPLMYRHWRTAMGRLLRISYPVRGNHETRGERSTPYAYYWRKCIVSFLPQIPQNGPSGEKGMTYSFSKQGAFFVGLDHFIPGNENRVNQGWLNQQLSANILPHVFVFGHEPAVAADPVLPNLAYYPLERDAFWESLSEAGAQVYSCGHHHLFNRATVTITDVNGQTTNPITQLIVGGGGAQFEPWPEQQLYPYLAGGGQPVPPSPESVAAPVDNNLENHYGYAIVTVDGNQVSITYYAGWPAGDGTTISWYPFDTFGYTVSSKTLGLKDVSQAIDPQILTDFYPGIAINKIGSGILTLNTGTSNYSGPITVSAGQMSVYGAYANAPVSVNGGQATLNGGSLNDVTVATGANLVGAGTVGNLTSNGYVCPDLVTGPRNLNVFGNFTQSAEGNFNVDIASTSNYGHMQVNGAANLSGVLIVSLQGSYSPAAGQSFPNIITASGGLTGTFSQIIANELPQNLTWQPTYTGNSVSLQAVSK